MHHFYDIFKKHRGINHPLSFSLHLTLNFILSTFIPFILVTVFLVHMFTQYQISNIIQTTESHMESLSRNISMYLSELEQATLLPYYDENFSYYLSDSNEGQHLSYIEKQRIRQSLGNMIEFIRLTRSDLQNVIIVNDDTCLFYSTALRDTTPEADFNYEQETWYQAAIEANGNVLLLPEHVPLYFGESSKPVFSLVRSLVNLRTRTPYAVIKADVPTEVFKNILQNVTFYVDSTIVLLDKNRHIIYQNNTLDLQIDPDDESDKELHGDTIRIGDLRYIECSTSVMPYDWTLRVYIDQKDIFRKQNSIYLTAIALYTFGILFALLSYLGISRKMVRSIHSISECLNAYKTGDFSVRYVSSSNDELAFLGKSVNNMGEQLDQLIQQEYISTLQRKEAEMRALQSQIRPHFLFNTIGNLIALNQLGKTQALEESLISLSSLLRYAVDSRMQVTLKEELNFCDNYLRLQKLRFGNKFMYSIQCPEKFEKIRIPQLMLQPFVENAVIHGIEPSDQDGFLLLKVIGNNDTIQIQVKDNGVGFDSSSVDGVGLRNSRERLLNAYPNSTLDIFSETGQGCCITITLRGIEREYTDC